MGVYINPNSDKREWLKSNAREVKLDAFKLETGTGEVPVVLVDNDWMQAIAVAHNAEEFLEFTRQNHSRPRTFYYVPYETAKGVIHADFHERIAGFEKK